jgi:oligosaccharide repeat unit polymerase
MGGQDRKAFFFILFLLDYAEHKGYDMPSGLFILAALLYLLLAWVFARRLFGVFDPLSFFLFSRIGVPLSFLILARNSFSFQWSVYLWACFLLFIVALFFSTRILRVNRIQRNARTAKVRSRLYDWLKLLFLVKAGVLVSVATTLPIFAKGGAGAYIGFDAENKVASALLFGLGTSDFTLACVLLPGSVGRTRVYLWIMAVISGITPLLTAKKSSVLSLIMALAIAKYVQSKLGLGGVSQSRRAYFAGLLALSLVAVGWAYWVFLQSADAMALEMFDSTLSILDFIAYQWAYVYHMFFVENILPSFVDVVQYNPLTYFFHSPLKFLGWGGAFEYSIGPALDQYLSGEVTGYGINPTFPVEGYVLFGFVGGLLFAALSGLFVGSLRSWLDRQSSEERGIVLIALLMQNLMAWPVDSLLFVKMATVSMILYVVGVVYFRFLRGVRGSLRRKNSVVNANAAPI